jgi:hypothetical protein
VATLADRVWPARRRGPTPRAPAPSSTAAWTFAGSETRTRLKRMFVKNGPPSVCERSLASDELIARDVAVVRGGAAARVLHERAGTPTRRSGSR